MTNPAPLPLTTPPPLDPLALEVHIRAFASFGHHRTGWPADDRATSWLIDELRASGVDAAPHRFPFRRAEVRAAHLRWDGEQIDGEPMYDAGFTPAGGLIAELTEPDDDELFGKLVLAPSADAVWMAAEARDHYQALAQSGVIGAVVPAADPLGELSLRNAVHIERPFSLPVLQIARRDVRRLAPAMMMRRELTLEIDADRLQSVATNVTATIPRSGDGPDESDEPPLVVTAPKSAWFASAGERGGGIAACLAIAAGIAQLPARRRTVHLLATSGHELNRAGMLAYLRDHPALASGACWVHLGASMGAMEATMQAGASDGALMAVLDHALTAAGIEDCARLDPGDPGFGEAREVHEAGGRFITFHGRHPFVHSPNDTFEVAVDRDQIYTWASAAWTTVHGLVAG